MISHWKMQAIFLRKSKKINVMSCMINRRNGKKNSENIQKVQVKIIKNIESEKYIDIFKR